LNWVNKDKRGKGIEGTRQNYSVTSGERGLISKNKIGGSDCLIKT